MDWKYKHFNQAAIFRESPSSVLEASRLVAFESFAELEDTSDGFVARGRSGWHGATATFHVAAAPEGAQVAVELVVERANAWGYMLFDIGGYYDGQIDHWFSAIARRLGGDHGVQHLQTSDSATSPDVGQILVSKTTSGVRTRRGCMAGCLVWLIVGACLGIAAYPLDRALFPQSTASTPGPIIFVGSLLSLLAGITGFLYVANPEAPTSKFIRERLRRIRKQDQ